MKIREGRAEKEGKKSQKENSFIHMYMHAHETVECLVRENFQPLFLGFCFYSIRLSHFNFLNVILCMHMHAY